MLLFFLYVVIIISYGSNNNNNNLFVQSQTNDGVCEMIKIIGYLCAKKIYQSEDIIIVEETNKPVDLTFTTIINEMSLTIPMNYSQKSNIVYKSFIIMDSCVHSIEDHYFYNLDNNRKQLKTIKLMKVKCLKILQRKSFIGIETIIDKLHFEHMPDLISIEEDFFDSFINLNTLSITNTNINHIPQLLLSKLTNIIYLKLNNNKLIRFPRISPERSVIMKKFKGNGNPLDCVCSLMEFVQMMTQEMIKKDYNCSSPPNLRGTHLSEVGNLCITTTQFVRSGNTYNKIYVKIGKQSEENDVAMGKVRIEIIAIIAGVLLIIVISIIVLVLCQRKRKISKQKANYPAGSPSKIIFQNSDYTEPLFKDNNI